MEELIKQLTDIMARIETDLLNAMLAMTLLVFAMFCNQVLGAVMARTGKENTFDHNRLLKSFLKGFLICLVILIFCVILDVAPILLERLDLIGQESKLGDMATALQVVTILVIAFVKYCKEVYEKLLTLFEVKKEQVDQFVQRNSHNQQELG